MTYLFIAGIIFFVVPLLIIEGFAHVILISFVRDDPDASNLFRMALFFMGFGLFLIVIHLVYQFISR